MTAALQAHLARGRSIHFVAGNHDAWLSDDAAAPLLRSLLKPQRAEQVQVHRWFYRVGSVHIEHGHLYDRDNSFPHPLGGFDPRTEPLGTALMRRFVAPNEAYFFAHAHRTTPAGGLLLTLKTWRWRAPLIIVNYFIAATSLVLDAALQKPVIRSQVEAGSRALREAADSSGVDAEILKRIVAEGAVTPRNTSARATFMRLYFDRVLASLFGFLSLFSLIVLGVLALVGLAQPSAALTSSLALLVVFGLGYLVVEARRRKNRYGGNIVEDVASRAELVRSLLGAKTIVLGHTHVPAETATYVNLGSFGYGRPNRSFAELHEDGSVRLANWPRNPAE
jgi:UDP-2,3-diacylglucosamine pyrophosphatase LpxH